MNGRFNEPRLMGNCSRCYYATRKNDRLGECVCARYPKWVDVDNMRNHFCGEFAWGEKTAHDGRL